MYDNNIIEGQEKKLGVQFWDLDEIGLRNITDHVWVEKKTTSTPRLKVTD